MTFNSSQAIPGFFQSTPANEFLGNYLNSSLDMTLGRNPEADLAFILNVPGLVGKEAGISSVTGNPIGFTPDGKEKYVHTNTPKYVPNSQIRVLNNGEPRPLDRQLSEAASGTIVGVFDVPSQFQQGYRNSPTLDRLGEYGSRHVRQNDFIQIPNGVVPRFNYEETVRKYPDLMTGPDGKIVPKGYYPLEFKGIAYPSSIPPDAPPSVHREAQINFDNIMKSRRGY